jgi:hypothetical protein
VILFKPFVALLQYILEPDDGIFRRVLNFFFKKNLGVAITYNLNDEVFLLCNVDELNKVLYFLYFDF